MVSFIWPRFPAFNSRLLIRARATRPTVMVLLAARDAGVKRFVYSSSSSVYGDQHIPLVETMTTRPISPYALQKFIGEEYTRLFHLLYGMETISLRYFNVYGPRQDSEGAYSGHIPKFMKAYCIGTQPTINGDGDQTRDNTYVADVISANILGAQTKDAHALGEAFNIGAGKNHSVNTVTAHIMNLAGSSVKPKHGPAMIEPRDTLADISKARALLGWTPMTNIEEGLAKTWEYFSATYA